MISVVNVSVPLGGKPDNNVTEETKGIPFRGRELCESRGGRPELLIPNRPNGLVDVKQHSTWTWTPMSSLPVYTYCCVLAATFDKMASSAV